MFNKYRKIRPFTKLAILVSANILLFIATLNVGVSLEEAGYLLATLTVIAVLFDVVIVHTSQILNLALIGYILVFLVGLYFIVPLLFEGVYVKYEGFVYTLMVLYAGFSLLTVAVSILIARGSLWVNVAVTQSLLLLSVAGFSVEIEMRGLPAVVLMVATAVGLSLLFLYFRQPSKRKKKELFDGVPAVGGDVKAEMRSMVARMNKLAGKGGEVGKAGGKFPYVSYSFNSHKLVMLPSYADDVFPIALESVFREVQGKDRKAVHIYGVNSPLSSYPVTERKLYKWKQPNALLTQFYYLNKDGQERMVNRLEKVSGNKNS